ncbi:hypothetical protein FB451DRAFT_1335185 [Mycena latifolia]|nr:hypothetical protein FB451DRAFT_1335185 [Mycena latifolia]
MRFTGNVSDEMKEVLSDLVRVYGKRPSDEPSFGDSIVAGMVVTHASVQNKADEPRKKEGRVVCELIVTEDGGGNGCSAFLIDHCSTLALLSISNMPNVSQSLNIVYHSPAGLGDKLRIINTTITVGARAMSIWNDTYHRLVASGVHIKMQPSKL